MGAIEHAVFENRKWAAAAICGIEPIALGLAARQLIDQAAGVGGVRHEASSVWQAFFVVGCQQRVTRQAALDEVELPHKVHGIANPGAQTLPKKWWRLVARIASEEDATLMHS